MGIITDILKDIPLSAVLRERITDLESKMTTMQQENTSLKDENHKLKTENIELKQQIEKLSHKSPPGPGAIVNFHDPKLDKI